ncbi:MAG: response regulator [Firmicutes bacterium]|nr:response regulator [Bacillota bacterium]
MYKILIVEDEHILRKGFKTSLDFAELNCTICAEAQNGQEGLEKIRQCKPDIVFTDLRMPVMDGLEMLRLSKEQEGYEAVILTGYEEFNYAKEAISLGVVDYLLKPIDRRELIEVIKKTVAKIEDTSNNTEDEEIVRQFIDIPVFKSPYTKGCYEYIRDHYPEKIKISDIADNLEVSVDYLNRVFKKETSMTINKFLIRYRIAQACVLMKQNNDRVYEVAEQVGFNEYKYFYEVFTKYVGISPTQYKKEAMDNKEDTNN